MDFRMLFERQRKIDKRIIEKHNLQEQELLPAKLLAFRVELGECANEHRAFKFWSVDRAPRTRKLLFPEKINENMMYYNPLLFEYIDGMCFLLSIGLDLGLANINVNVIIHRNVIEQFNNVYRAVDRFERRSDVWNYLDIWRMYLGLAKLFEFDDELLEVAYLEKYYENHARQNRNY